MDLTQTRRTFNKLLVAAPLIAACGRLLKRRSAPNAATAASESDVQEPAHIGHYDVIVIGTGFGGTMAGLTLARRFKERNRGERLLMLERGAWWTTPVETVQDKQIRTPHFLGAPTDQGGHGQPVRYWASADHLRGLIDVLLRCIRREQGGGRFRTFVDWCLQRERHHDGLYDLAQFGAAKGLASDGITVVRANGVGGGSLIYANVTIEPPDSVLRDWQLSWDTVSSPHVAGRPPANRAEWFDLARHAIGYGVLSAWETWEHWSGKGMFVHQPPTDKTLPLNTGLSNIATRSARINPAWTVVQNPLDATKGIRRLDPKATTNSLWIDRARVFQSAAEQVLDARRLPKDYGLVDSSINDLTPEGVDPNDERFPPPNFPRPDPKNYCERQGRCMIGCLPGARHTLNKQLMKALWGTPNEPHPQIGEPFLQLRALAEVESIAPFREGGFEISFLQRSDTNPAQAVPYRVSATRVIVAAGSVGTAELLLKCKHRLATLPNLSDDLGNGFSINGDYLAFTDNTTETVSLTRGPMTTSFAHFNSTDSSAGGSSTRFHTIEDMGVPRVFSLLFGEGSDILSEFAATGLTPQLFTRIVIKQLKETLRQVGDVVGTLFGTRVPPERFQSEDVPSRNVMCYAAMGRDAADGQLRLGAIGDSPLRVVRPNGARFDEDPIYDDIKRTLDEFSAVLQGTRTGRHESTFKVGLTPKPVLGVSHPLGGCRIQTPRNPGVVDEFGRVLGYDGLYVADAALVPSALGVNPSLTISALALRIGRKLIEDHYGD